MCVCVCVCVCVCFLIKSNWFLSGTQVEQAEGADSRI